MALTQENVHYTLNSGPDVMKKSNRVHARIQEFLSGGGGGGGGGSRPDGQKTVWTMFFLVISLFYSLQSGSNGFTTEGRRGSNFSQGVGVSKETHITCDFPLWIRTWGRLTPLFAYRIMVYQNLNKTENTTQRRLNGKSYLLLVEIASADPEGVRGSRPPGKSQVIWVSIGYKQLDPPGKKLDPPPPWKMLDPLWNLEK